MSTHLIIDGNAVYEIDEECMEQKESMQKAGRQRGGISKKGRTDQSGEIQKDSKVRHQE